MNPGSASSSWATPFWGGSRGPAAVLEAVRDLRRDVAATELLLDLPDVAAAREVRARLLDQVDGHLLPRLERAAAPAVVVVAGSTGAGKSTLVNSLVGREVSTAGVLRPTTRRPVLVHHPDDGELLAGHPLLDVVDVVADGVLPRGIALVDAPDLDSVETANRQTALRLLEAADLWLFVTTAARYGDALPWAVLERAADRGTSVAVVLNRVPPDALVEVRGDLLGRLRAEGMSSVPLFVLEDLGPHEGLLAEAAVAPVRRWLAMVAGPDRGRAVIARTQRGSLRALRPWVETLAEAVQQQVDARHRIEDAVERAVADPAEAAARSVRAGAVVDGPVRARWQALAVSRHLTGRWARRRGRAERVAALAEIRAELAASATLVLAAARRRGDLAARRVLEHDVPGAQAVLTALEDPQILRAAAVDAQAPEDSARAWLAEADAAAQRVAEGEAGPDRRTGRRLLELGEEAAGALVASAAAGLGAARVALVEALGRGADEVLDVVLDDLADRAAQQVRAGGEPARRVLQVDMLADDAASRLRLRLAVLKDLT